MQRRFVSIWFRQLATDWFTRRRKKPNALLGADFLICDGQVVSLKPQLLNSEATYSWQDGSSLKNFDVHNPGVYWLKMTNDCGSNTDTVLVEKGICEVYIPNAFTPNGDGLNDLFKVMVGGDLTDFQMQVYNRWGQLVFESKQISKGWNGYYKSELQQYHFKINQLIL